MKEIFKHIPLYRFLMCCNETDMIRTVLDCGAGGDTPPLSLFREHGYTTYGIEFSPEQLELAGIYAAKNGQDLNIELGDMRQLTFADESMGFVYSYNSIFHMRKNEVNQSVAEMKRVLKPGGLMFVNFLTTNDFRCGLETDLGQHQYEQMEDGIPTIHSYYDPNEPDSLLSDLEFLYKEDRVLERIYEGERIRQGFVDYIVKKRG